MNQLIREEVHPAFTRPLESPKAGTTLGTRRHELNVETKEKELAERIRTRRNFGPWLLSRGEPRAKLFHPLPPPQSEGAVTERSQSPFLTAWRLRVSSILIDKPAPDTPPTPHLPPG